jgi:hypothetical protein
VTFGKQAGVQIESLSAFVNPFSPCVHFFALAAFMSGKEKPQI